MNRIALSLLLMQLHLTYGTPPELAAPESKSLLAFATKMTLPERILAELTGGPMPVIEFSSHYSLRPDTPPTNSRQTSALSGAESGVAPASHQQCVNQQRQRSHLHQQLKRLKSKARELGLGNSYLTIYQILDDTDGTHQRQEKYLNGAQRLLGQRTKSIRVIRAHQVGRKKKNDQSQ